MVKGYHENVIKRLLRLRENLFYDFEFTTCPSVSGSKS